MKVTVAATQFACTQNPAENVAKADSLVRQAAARGAQVILIQELFETPYFCKDHLASHFSTAHPVPDNPLVRHFQGLARELGVVLPVSVFERANQAYYNSLVMVDADGAALGVYRKSHIPEGPGYHEKFYFSPGDTGFRVWPTRFGTHRRGHLLGPVVPRVGPLHGPARRGHPDVSHRDRLRAAGRHARLARPLATLHAGPRRRQPDAAGRVEPHRRRARARSTR